MDNTGITMKAAQDTLRASMETIHSSCLRVNETNIEEYLQSSIQKYPLGQRLHRWAAMGPKDAKKAKKELEDPDFLCKTFITAFRITTICDKKVGGKRKPEWVELSGKKVKVQH